jgi:hypothetical protein
MDLPGGLALATQVVVGAHEALVAISDYFLLAMVADYPDVSFTFFVVTVCVGNCTMTVIVVIE